jgi:citrate synthase
MKRRRYLTATEATELLGIHMGTLYSYVSRGLVRSEVVEADSRQRRYHAEDCTDQGTQGAAPKPNEGGAGRCTGVYRSWNQR